MTFTLKIKVKDNGKSVTFTGQGNGDFEAKIDIDFWTDYLVDYKVKITATDAAGNDIEWEKKINGVFGGFLDVLTAIWDLIAGAFAAAFELMMAALDFLVDLILEIVKSIINSVLSPIKNAMLNFAKSIGDSIDEALEEIAKSNPSFEYHSKKAAEIIWGAITSGTFFYAVLALCAAILVIEAVTTPYSAVIVPVKGVFISFLKEEITKLTIGYAMVIGASTIAAASAEAILFMVKPESDNFWKEGIGLSTFGICTALGNLIVIAPYASLLGLKAFGDIIGLFIGIIGFVLSAYTTLLPPIIGAFSGFAIAALGFGLTLPNDAMDSLGSPLSIIEEVVSSIAFIYSFANVVDVATD